MQSFTAILILGLAAAAMAEFNFVPKPSDFQKVGQVGAEAIERGVGAGVHRAENNMQGNQGINVNHGIQREAGVLEHGDIQKREASPYSYYYPYTGYPSSGYRSYYPYSALSSMYPYSSYKLAVPSTPKGYPYYFNY